MSNLVEAHAAAVKPSLAHVDSPTAAVAEQAKARRRSRRPRATRRWRPRRPRRSRRRWRRPSPRRSSRSARSSTTSSSRSRSNLERGMWVEFESDDGQLAFAKLAWVSPLRGTYLFTNRQGQKALSMTAEELAERFRTDKARLVEAEPLIDRAFGSMMAQIGRQVRRAGDVTRVDVVRAHAADPAAFRHASRADDVPISHRRADHRRRDPDRQARGPASRRM